MRGFLLSFAMENTQNKRLPEFWKVRPSYNVHDFFYDLHDISFDFDYYAKTKDGYDGFFDDPDENIPELSQEEFNELVYKPWKINYLLFL